MQAQVENVMLITIGDKAREQDYIQKLTELEARLFNVVHGSGFSSRGGPEAVGMGSEKDKVIIYSVIAKACSEQVINMLEQEFFSKPKTGIAFTLEIESVVY